MGSGVRIYAGTRDGLHVHDLDGGRVEFTAQHFPDEIVQALTASRQTPECVFVALRDGLHRSCDAGASWSRVLERDVRSITVDPSDDRVVYAGTDPVGLFRSEDGGDTWEELTGLLRLPDETHAKLNEWEPLDMSLRDEPGFRHRRQDWWFQEPPHQGHVLQIFVHPNDPNVIMLSIEHGGAAFSADRGETWDDISGGIDYLDIHYVTAVPGFGDRYLLTSARGMYATDDPLAGWIRAEEGCERDYFHDVTFLERPGGAVTLVATADGSPGVWRRSGRGARGALHRSQDGGRSWERVGAGKGLPEEMDAMIWAMGAHPSENETVIAAVGVSSGVPSRSRAIGSGSLMMTDDSGDSWNLLVDGLPGVEHLTVAAN